MLITWASIHWFLTTILVVLSVATALHALTHKRDPRASLLWIIICMSIPFAGSVFYLLFGINRAHNHVQKLGAAPDTLLSENPDLIHPQKNIEHSSPHQLLGSALTGLPLTTGNLIEMLVNGEEAYPAMLQAINEAREWVYLSSYIFETKGIGQDFIDALVDAKDRGVDVCVLLDGQGAGIAGVKQERFWL